MRKKVIVSGGSSGIEQAIAQRFAKEVWTVMVGAHDGEATQNVVNGLFGKGHIAVEVDVTSERQIEYLNKQVKEKFTTFHTLEG